MKRRNSRTDGNSKLNVDRQRSLWKWLLCVAILSLLVIDGHKLIPRFRYWWRNREIRQEYVLEVDKLRQKRDRLKEELHKLKHNRLTQERLAREMGFIRSGETVYKFAPEAQMSDPGQLSPFGSANPQSSFYKKLDSSSPPKP